MECSVFAGLLNEELTECSGPEVVVEVGGMDDLVCLYLLAPYHS